MFLLNETEMGQNNSVFVFVRKTWKYSHRRPNLIIDMNQVTNLKSLGFTWEKWQIYRESPQVFDPHISAIVRFVSDCVAKLLYVPVLVEDYLPAPTLWSTNPMKLSAFHPFIFFTKYYS